MLGTLFNGFAYWPIKIINVENKRYIISPFFCNALFLIY